MNDDIDRIHAEIDRRALHTADPRPLALFVERERLRKRAQMWTLAGGAIGVLAGFLAFFAFLANNDFGVPEAGAVAVAVFFPIATIARRDLNAKIGDWMVRAKQVVGG
jgi:peptidoglycan/LPS O-acetylase OafA/YrhL